MKTKKRKYKTIYNQKCPYCHREKMIIKETYRINYPFGIKAKPRLILISRKKFCGRCGEIR